jgi:UDP-glucose 4-epimerase
MDIYRKLRVAITGGFGFLGRNLVERLIQLGSMVIVVDNSIPFEVGKAVDADPDNSSVRYILADIRDQDQMKQVVGQCDILFSLAGKSGASDSIQNPLIDLDINCRGQLTILEAARKYNPDIKLVFPSSRLVYGKTVDLPVREDHATKPTSIYGIHKLTCENYYLMYFQLYGLKSSILRLTNPYGPNQDLNDRSYGIINKMISTAVSGGTIQLFGEGEQLRDYIYIDDVINAMLLSAISDETNGNVCNLGSGTGISMREMADLVVRLSGTGSIEYVPWPVEYAEVETGSFVADIERFTKTMNWKPETDLRTGLSNSIDYYRNVSARSK